MPDAIVVRNLPEFSKALEENVALADAAGRRIVERGSVIVSDAARMNFRPRPAGSRRVSSISGQPYFAGAPLFPAVPPLPTLRTGNLRESIRAFLPTMISPGVWMGSAGTRLNYAPFVEYGTSRARKFPYMGKALEDSAVELAAVAREEWARARI